jgi:hypothetical protein
MESGELRNNRDKQSKEKIGVLRERERESCETN